jgi:hypothetical protein
MRIFDREKYIGDEMLRCKTLIKYAILDSKREEKDQKLGMYQIDPKEFQWLSMTPEERKKRLNFFSCINWANLSFWDQKEVLTDLKKFIHRDDIHIYTKAKKAKFLSNKDSKELGNLKIHMIQVSNIKRGFKTKRCKFVNYEVPKRIQKNGGKTKQKLIRNIQLELPEWCHNPSYDDSFGLDLNLEDLWMQNDYGLAVFPDEYDELNEEFSLSELI